jgi:hypothetical protein
VSTSGDASTVTVLGDDGTTEEVDVEVGAVGSDRTEVVAGLEEGQEVVLADLAEPLPSSSDDGGATTEDDWGGTLVRPGGGELPSGFRPPG